MKHIWNSLCYCHKRNSENFATNFSLKFIVMHSKNGPSYHRNVCTIKFLHSWLLKIMSETFPDPVSVKQGILEYILPFTNNCRKFLCPRKFFQPTTKKMLTFSLHLTMYTSELLRSFPLCLILCDVLEAR
jgi:hypothetical protein